MSIKSCAYVKLVCYKNKLIHLRELSCKFRRSKPLIHKNKVVRSCFSVMCFGEGNHAVLTIGASEWEH